MGWDANILTEAYPANFPALTTEIPEGGTLLLEINNSGITAVCQNVGCDSGTCTMTFDTTPSAGDKTDIATVISNHTGELPEGSAPITDEAFRIVDSVDTTKELAFDISGVTTDTTRTITIPDENIILDDANDTRDPNAHTIGGSAHSADTLANLNSKISDATLDDSSATRTPSSHASTHQNGGADEISVTGLSGLLADNQNPIAHTIGGVYHSSDTLANLNSKISDATLDDSSATRTPTAHTIGGSAHSADTLANLNSKISDATLDDSNSTRTPTAHASSHQSGGGDAIKLDDLASPDDNTDLNATTSIHGLLRKLSGSSSDFLNGVGNWAVPSGGGSSDWPINFFDGLFIKRNGTNPAYQIDVEPGACRSDDNTTNIPLTSTITVDITTSGANGLDTGSEANSTWYFLYLIYNTTTETTASLLSISSSSPTLPSGYTKKRLIGSTFNNASGNFRLWDLYSTGSIRTYVYTEENENTVQVLSSGSATTWTDLDCSDFISPIATIGRIMVLTISGYQSNYAMFRPKGASESTPNTRVFGGTDSSGDISSSSQTFDIKTSTSQIIEYSNSSSDINTYVWINGYIEIL